MFLASGHGADVHSGALIRQLDSREMVKMTDGQYAAGVPLPEEGRGVSNRRFGVQPEVVHENILGAHAVI